MATTYCEYPRLPLRRNESDAREFNEGDEVCLRNQHANIPRRGTYVRPHPQPGTGRVYTHIVTSPGYPERWVKWEDLGKVKHPRVSKTLVRKMAEHKNLPENVENVISKFGGGKRKRRVTRKRRTSNKR